MAKSTTKSRPQKPRPDFPLFAHASGRWCKKIRGELRYFGPWRDPQGALARYLAQKDDLHAGRKPRPQNTPGLTVKDACNFFLEHKNARVATGELAKSTWLQYRITARRLVRIFGSHRLVEDLRIDDFEMLRAKFAETNGLVGLRHQITNTRCILGYAAKAGLIDKPVVFGPSFSRPSARAIRRQRRPRMFEAHELRTMLDAATPTWRAMILLGINCGYGPADVGRLPEAALDLHGGWVTFARPKTGSDRRCPLWPETREALQEVLATRPAPDGTESVPLVFRTATGGSYYKPSTRYISEQFRYFLVGLNLYQKGRNFYTLRHVCETIGSESRDQIALDFLMGHETGHMRDVYRERISDRRLQDVAEFIRRWLFSNEASQDTADEPLTIPFSTENTRRIG